MIEQRCLFCGGDSTEPNHWEFCDGRQGGRVEDVPPFRPHEHARTTDPDTSHAAAWAVSDATEVQLRVIELLGECAMTDEELIVAYHRKHGDDRIGEAQLSPRKRRSDLTRFGWVVDSGIRRTLRSGRQGVVWTLAAHAKARAS